MVGNDLKDKFSRKQTEIPTWENMLRKMSEISQVGTKELNSPSPL